MFFFNKKYSLVKTDFFKGFTDYHCHILYNVDDGIKRIEDSLNALEYYSSIGIRRVVLTPHIMEDVDTTWADREAKFAKLCATYQGQIELSLSGEYMLDEGFNTENNSGLHPLFDKNILVETSFMSAPYDMDELLYEVQLAGFTPIIAHPERYLYMEFSQYAKLIEQGCKLQLNIPSLAGVYGEKVRLRALKLLLDNKYSLIGTDLHNLNAFKSYIDNPLLRMKDVNALLDLKEKL